jgi:hypothetical protein
VLKAGLRAGLVGLGAWLGIYREGSKPVSAFSLGGAMRGSTEKSAREGLCGESWRKVHGRLKPRGILSISPCTEDSRRRRILSTFTVHGGFSLRG